MEGCAKLEYFLEDHELLSISESAKVKICEKFSSFNQLISELRNENSELSVVLERDQFKFETEISASRRQLQESIEQCTKLKSQVTELEENLSSVQKQWRDLSKTHDSSMLELQSTKRDNELLNQEKRNLSEQLEKRRAEIEKLNGDLKCLLDQVTSANEAKFEAIAASEEAKLKESNLQHKVTRLEQEKELLNRQISDLHAELTQKNSEIHTLKREKSSNSLELKAQLEARADEVHMVQKRLDCYKEIIEEKDLRIEALAQKIRQLNQSHSKAEEQFNLELSAQAKLIDLHKNASEDNQKRVQELMRAFEEAQKLHKESNDSCEEMEKHCRNVESKCRAQLEEKHAEMLKVKEDMRRAKAAAHGISQETIEKMFPVAAATSKCLHSGMTLTELYVEHTRLQDELQQQKNENANLARDMKQIIAEIEEKTPVINQRMQEHDKLIDTISCLKSQLAHAASDCEKILEERNDAKRTSNLSQRENTRLKSQVVDLNRQVQSLLKEVEEARGGKIKNNRGSAAMREEEVTSSDDITAAEVISRHLVTFRDIEEIQLNNQKLLAVIRDLSQQHEEMEKKLSSEITSKFEKEIATLSMELEDLQKKRATQSEMLETIIRQRDMYHVLLTNQGFSESLLRHPDGSSSFVQKTPFSPDSQAKETKNAMNQLQAEFNNYKKEKAENERMLNEQVDKMRTDISDLRIQNAKLASQCEYSEERVKMLQSNLETYKKEYASYKEKNRQHSALIIQHQQTINSLRQDLMVAQEKIAKSDVTIENLKAERDLSKSVESRLLQEKESVVREQQHQSRMMSNLQAVQNNLERIESETKRNLQYQVEKFEKENAILKTKVDNANEEYRSAVKIWEKQKRELQSKVDAEIERSRKTHEDLVDAYSQVHALNQELLNTKLQLTSEKSATTDSPQKTPTKTAASVAKVASTAADVKHLKEQLTEIQSKLKSSQDKLTLTSKSADQYLSMCKDLEQRVKEQDEINKHLKESMDSALQSNSDARTALDKKLEEMEKNNRELIEENMKLTQDSNSQVNDLQKKLTESLRSIDDYRNQAEVSKKTANQAREDCQNQIKLMHDVQEKYERELMLHAQDMKTLSEIKEEHKHCCLKIEKLSETAKAAEQALTDSRESWARQEAMLRSETDALKTKVVDIELCNHNLHNQLEMMGTQMAALQSKNWEETPYSSIQSDLKDTQHLLQVIQFIKKEKEIASTQYDVAQSENVRLNLKVDQLTNELKCTKAELNEVMSNLQAKAASEAQHADLLKKIGMMNILSESNNLLRSEKESMLEKISELETQYQDLMEKFQPLSEKEKEISQQIDVLSAENNALKLEVKSWQSRTNQLLEQSHRIGPQEYKNMVREMEELKSQKQRLAEELQRKQAEVSQHTAHVVSLRKELESAQNEVREKSEELGKINEGSAEHQKTLLQIKKIGRKYKTQYDELKDRYDVLVAKSKAAESTNQEQAIQDLQKKVEEAEKIIRDLRAEINKQKESADEAKKTVENVQSKANEKEEKAKKLLAQFRQRYSQLNSQKDALNAENARLSKDIEENKTKLSNLLKTQEESTQMNSQSSAKIVCLEKELKKANELRKEKDFLQKQCDELLQKVSQQKQGMKSQIVGLGERTSGAEPLTANIKPLTSPSTSGASSSLRHSPHPHAASSANRPTPTASIRPMAIGTATPAAASQTRMATVLPTTATPHPEEDSVLVVAPTPAVAVPHATVQPTPATATVAPTTMAVTVSPVISEVSPTIAHEEAQAVSIPSMHIAGSPAVPIPATALVPPRIDLSESIPDTVPVESPAPTTSVIVSPPTTQTQVVTPTVKRSREESPGPDGVDGSMKRIRMVSEGSQTNQHPITSVVTPTNIAVVPAAQIVTRSKSQSSPIIEPEPSSSTQTEVKEPPVLNIEALQPLITAPQEELIAAPIDSSEAELLDDDKEPIDWEAPEEEKIDDDFETEGMEEEAIIDEDIEQMQGIDARSPDDEDMAEEQQDDTEEMLEQSTPTIPDIDILDATSDIQMDADSSSLQNAPTEQCMAPPAFPPTLEISSSASPTVEPSIVAGPSAVTPRVSLPVGPPRLERQPPVNRQHLTPFTIPGQGSNFEEGDDGIVPSTPTLYVPRRIDGFAEAVSSPHVPQVRFLFSSSDSSPTQQGLSQLASQGALGVDDTRMDLSQFDEGGRTVPTTPIQVSPPAEATVPEVINPVAETDIAVTRTEMTIPVIKVDLADDPVDSPAIAAEKLETSSIEAPVAGTSKTEVVSKEADRVVETEDKSGLPEIKVEISVSGNTTSAEAKAEEPSTETEQAKDVASSPASQRKPIVWKPKPEASPLTVSEHGSLQQEAVMPSGAGLLTAPTRGRSRARRARYAGAAAAGYSRGRGNENVWSGPGRRGRGATRRRTMY